MDMERMEYHLRFEACGWYNDPSVKVVILQNEEAVSMLEASNYESQLDYLGFCMGLTSESTSQPYHQNIVGVEGWLVNLVNKEYTRLDQFEINWLNSNKGYPKLSFNDLGNFVSDLPGQAQGIQFGI